MILSYAFSRGVGKTKVECARKSTQDDMSEATSCISILFFVLLFRHLLEVDLTLEPGNFTIFVMLVNCFRNFSSENPYEFFESYAGASCGC